MKTSISQRAENIEACKALYQFQVKAQATEAQLRDTYLKLVDHSIKYIGLRFNSVEFFSVKKHMIDTIKDCVK